MGFVLLNKLIVRVKTFEQSKNVDVCGKFLVILLTLILPLTVDAKIGWSFVDYSLMAGQQYRFGQQALLGFDFQYDKCSKSCTRYSNYKGIGVSCNFNNSQTELGIKGMWNPTRLIVFVSRSTKFYPYLFGQGNFIQTKSQNPVTIENKQMNCYNIRPGLGLTGNFRDYKVLSIRTYIQVGYNIPFNSAQNLKNSLTFEFKLGLGLNAMRLKRNQEKELETEQQENK